MYSKKIKCEDHQPPLMTDNIKRSLIEHSTLTKCYYKNGQKKSDHENLLEKPSDCTKKFLEKFKAKKRQDQKNAVESAGLF